MMPRLGEKYEIEIMVISKPKAEFHTDEYYALDLPEPEPPPKGLRDRLFGK